MPTLRSRSFSLLIAFSTLLGASAGGWAQSPASSLPQELVETPLQGRYVSGETFAIHFHKSGKIEHRGRNLNSSGHWTDEEGLLCTRYDGQIVTDCWQTVKVGANCYHVMTKALKVVVGPEKSLQPLPYRLHALVWRSSEPSTCDVPAS